MAYLIDTNILLFYLRTDRQRAIQHVPSVPAGEALCAETVPLTQWPRQAAIFTFDDEF
jgi:hypothetical protein